MKSVITPTMTACKVNKKESAMKKIDYETYVKPSAFYRIKTGENRLRIVSSGILCYEHGLATGKGYIPMGICTEDSRCEQCAKGNEPKLRYKWLVYDFSVKQVKVLAVGPKIGDEICMIGKAEARMSFEILINRKGIGRQSRYDVSSVKSTPIDAQSAQLTKSKHEYMTRRFLGL